MPKPGTSSPLNFSGDEEEDQDLNINMDTALSRLDEAVAETVEPNESDPDESNEISLDQDDHDDSQASQSQALVLHSQCSVQSSLSLLGALEARTPRSSTPSRSSHSRSHSHSRTEDDSSASILGSGPRAKKPKQRLLQVGWDVRLRLNRLVSESLHGNSHRSLYYNCSCTSRWRFSKLVSFFSHRCLAATTL